MKKTLLIILLIAVLIFIAAVVFTRQSTEKQLEQLAEEGEQKVLPVDPDISDEPEAPEDMIIVRDVYFATVVDGQEQIEAVQREFPVPTDERETVLHKLLEGPTNEEKEQGYTTAISEEVTLNSFHSENGIAYADFSEELDASGSATVTMIRDQIEKTLLQFEDIDEVVISIKGETEEILQP